MSKLGKPFGGCEQRGTGPGAEIEQAGNFRLRCAQLDFSKHAVDCSICCRQSYCEVSRAMRFSGNSRTGEISSLVVLGKLRDCLCQLAPVYLPGFPLNGALQFGGKAHG